LHTHRPKPGGPIEGCFPNAADILSEFQSRTFNFERKGRTAGRTLAEPPKIHLVVADQRPIWDSPSRAGQRGGGPQSRELSSPRLVARGKAAPWTLTGPMVVPRAPQPTSSGDYFSRFRPNLWIEASPPTLPPTQPRRTTPPPPYTLPPCTYPLRQARCLLPHLRPPVPVLIDC